MNIPKIPDTIPMSFTQFPADGCHELYIRVAILEPRVQALLRLDLPKLNRILENALQVLDLQTLYPDIEQCMDQIAAVPKP